jgi:hypothetical protein
MSGIRVNESRVLRHLDSASTAPACASLRCQMSCTTLKMKPE